MLNTRRSTLASSVSSRFLAALGTFRVRSDVGLRLISLTVVERLRLLCLVIQEGRLMLGPPLAKCTTNRLPDTLNEENFEHLLGIYQPVSQRFSNIIVGSSRLP